MKNRKNRKKFDVLVDLSLDLLAEIRDLRLGSKESDCKEQVDTILRRMRIELNKLK